jgi:sugar/nucleoside kinase (ribokinase family)
MSKYDLYAIGNALVDSEFEVSEDKLAAMGVLKRHMTLVDADQRLALREQLADSASRQNGGGSAGNTAVALAQLGGTAFYSCRVGDDALGQFYAQDLKNNGVASNLERGLVAGALTGNCTVMVTPDAERSMCTYLGTSAELDRDALDVQAIEQSKMYYMEGYLAASPTGLQAALAGKAVAKEAGVALALTLSDMSMINFCRDGLEAMADGGVDYLFCNEEEAQQWCGSTDIDVLCVQLSTVAQTVCLTRSAKGCLIIEGSSVVAVEGVPVKALDTNGAGDMFAGAFMYALTQGKTKVQAAQLANACASLVVSQYGNRVTTERLQAVAAGLLAA